MKAPTHIFKDFLTQPVALPRPETTMIGRAVAFDGKHVATRLVSTADSKVNLETGRADLLVDFVAAPFDKGPLSRPAEPSRAAVSYVSFTSIVFEKLGN